MIAKARIHSRRKDSIAGRHVTDRMVDSRHPDSSGLVSQGLMQVRHRSHEVWILPEHVHESLWKPHRSAQRAPAPPACQWLQTPMRKAALIAALAPAIRRRRGGRAVAGEAAEAMLSHRAALPEGCPAALPAQCFRSRAERLALLPRLQQLKLPLASAQRLLPYAVGWH